MRMNVEKVLERDQKLSELDDRTGKNVGSDAVLQKQGQRASKSKGF
jgi:hypothetical protein